MNNLDVEKVLNGNSIYGENKFRELFLKYVVYIFLVKINFFLLYQNYLEICCGADFGYISIPVLEKKRNKIRNY